MTPESFFENYENMDVIREDQFLITFDDGLYSSFYATQTILSKYNIKAVFFIPTKMFDLKSEKEMKEFAYKQIYREKIPINEIPKSLYKTMVKDHVIELSKQGHWILPHTFSHCDISGIQNTYQANMELLEPKLMLEDLLGVRIRAFAFPIGNEKVVNWFAYRYIKSTYDFCFTGIHGKNTIETNKHYLYRDSIHAHFPLSHVKNIVEGVFDGYYSLKMKKIKLLTTKNGCKYRSM